MDRPRLLRLALGLSILSIVVSGLVGTIAVAAALASGSLSLLGFGMDAAIDSVASAALVWRFASEVREPERAHRIETIAEAIIGAVLLVLAAYLAFGAVLALISGAHPEASVARLVLLVVGLVVLPPLAVAKYRVARSLGSGALRADSLLTAVAAGLALIGLLALAASEVIGVTWADAVGALAVAVVVAREGWLSLRAMQAYDL